MLLQLSHFFLPFIPPSLQPPHFTSLPLLPTSQLCPFRCWFLGRWVCVHSRIHGPIQWILLWGWEFLPPLQPPQKFTARGFEYLVFHAGTLGFTAYLVPQLSLPAYPWTNVGLPSPPTPASPAWSFALLYILSTRLPVSVPSTSLDECFFNFLVVGVPCSLVFWQFWFLFVFKLVVIFLFACERKLSFSTYASILAGTTTPNYNCL